MSVWADILVCSTHSLFIIVTGGYNSHTVPARLPTMSMHAMSKPYGKRDTEVLGALTAGACDRMCTLSHVKLCNKRSHTS